jgi:hypothetical protein
MGCDRGGVWTRVVRRGMIVQQGQLGKRDRRALPVPLTPRRFISFLLACTAAEHPPDRREQRVPLCSAPAACRRPHLFFFTMDQMTTTNDRSRR